MVPSVYAFGLSNYRIISHSSHFGRVFCLFSITHVQFSEKRISKCLISFQATARYALFLILPDYCLHRKAAQTIHLSNEMLPRMGCSRGSRDGWSTLILYGSTEINHGSSILYDTHLLLFRLKFLLTIFYTRCLTIRCANFPGYPA